MYYNKCGFLAASMTLVRFTNRALQKKFDFFSKFLLRYGLCCVIIIFVM